VQEKDILIAPLVSRANRYSFAALFGFLSSHLSRGLGSGPGAKRVAPLGACEDVHSILRSAEPQTHIVFAFSFCTPDIAGAAALIRNVREAVSQSGHRNTTLVAGGPHPSGDPAGCLRMGIDICVVGPGEIPFLEILEALARGRRVDGLPGVVTRAGQSPQQAPDVDLDGYLPAYPEARLFAPIEISRGCPQGCAFCQTAQIFGARMRHRSTETLARWFREVRDRGHTTGRVITPNAFAYGSACFDTPNHGSLEHVLRSACESVGRENVYFGGFPSEVWPKSVTREAVRLVKRFTANRRLVLGAQSGCQAVLDRIHRRHTPDDVERAVRIILDEHLTADVDFIVGFPGETDEERAESVRFMRELVNLGARIHTHSFLPLAGTRLYDSAPSPVDPDTRLALEQLSGSGVAFGQWLTQENLAAEIRAYRADPRSH